MNKTDKVDPLRKVEAAYKRELGPSIEALVLAARDCYERGLEELAGVYYRVLLARTSPPIQSAAQRVGRGEACLFYARRALAKKRMGKAADWYRDALSVDPLATEYRIELITKVLTPMG